MGRGIPAFAGMTGEEQWAAGFLLSQE